MNADAISVPVNGSSNQLYETSFAESANYSQFGSMIGTEQCRCHPSPLSEIPGETPGSSSGFGDIFKDVIGLVRELVHKIVDMIMGKVLEPIVALGAQEGAEAGSAPLLRGTSSPAEVQGTTALQNETSDSGSSISKWIDKAASYGDKLGDLFDWVGEKKDKVVSVATSIWDGVSGWFS